MATITEGAWPYVQHRGGPPGFLKVLDPLTLAFPDFGGNRQLLTTGSVSRNDRVALFLMDYPRQERLKLLGHARVLDAKENQELVRRIQPDGPEQPRVERVFVIDVISFDWNCPNFITPRFTEEEMQVVVAPLHQRIAELEKQLAEQRALPRTAP